MCDGCGCDKLKGSDDRERHARQKAGGWHVHADGTVHRHDHSHGHSHPYVPGRTPRVAAMQAVAPDSPSGNDKNDGADGRLDSAQTG